MRNHPDCQGPRGEKKTRKRDQTLSSPMTVVDVKKQANTNTLVPASHRRKKDGAKETSSSHGGGKVR